MLETARSSVSPCEMHPRMAGHATTIMPVSSRSTVTMSFIVHPLGFLRDTVPELLNGAPATSFLVSDCCPVAYATFWVASSSSRLYIPKWKSAAVREMVSTPPTPSGHRHNRNGG